MKNMMKKVNLKIILQKIPRHPNPKIWYEQYTIDSNSASEILWIAHTIYNEIFNKKIMDLGCGTGRLAIGAAILGASYVIGVDLDRESLSIAKKYSNIIGVNNLTDFIIADIKYLPVRFVDTVIQNPPFGVQVRGMDTIFLSMALNKAKAIFSIHKSNIRSRNYLIRLINKKGGCIKGIYTLEILIPATYKFHRRRNYRVKADLYIIQMEDNK
jgi:putative methylase